MTSSKGVAPKDDAKRRSLTAPDVDVTANVRFLASDDYPLALERVLWADVVFGRPGSVVGMAAPFLEDKTVVTAGALVGFASS